MVNKLIRFGTLAAFAGSGLATAALADTAPMQDTLGVNSITHDNIVAQGYGSPSMAAPVSKDPGFMAGPVKITFGGFTEFASIYRSRNETGDVGSNFGQIPFANSNNYFLPEYRQSARQSRFAFLAQGPNDGVNKAELYMETDFLSSGTSSNSNESNSYTLRMRQFYAVWKNEPYDFYVLAGQGWSLATLYKKGLIPRQESTPLTIDAQYVTGFNWARQAELRVVKNFGSVAALGFSLEEPQNVIKGATPSGATGNNSGGSLLNSTTTYSTDVAPDLITKLAVDPGYGHYEIYGMARFLHDRGEKTPGTKSTQSNNTTVAGSVGIGAIVPVIPKMLDVQFTGLVGTANGRYGSGQLADSTFNTGDGSISAVREQQAMVGLIGHPTPTLDTYVYAGMEHAKTAYGLNADESACNINTSAGAVPPTGAAAACGGFIGTERQVAGGVWWKFYKGALGYLMTGAQLSYTANETFADAKGYVGRTNDTMAFLSFRYYPFQ
jgi:hypothetical protein